MRTSQEIIAERESYFAMKPVLALLFEMSYVDDELRKLSNLVGILQEQEEPIRKIDEKVLCGFRSELHTVRDMLLISLRDRIIDSCGNTIVHKQQKYSVISADCVQRSLDNLNQATGMLNCVLRFADKNFKAIDERLMNELYEIKHAEQLSRQAQEGEQICKDMPELVDDEKALCRKCLKINAIKAYRDRTGCGLREAKAKVEQYQRTLFKVMCVREGAAYPHNYAPDSREEAERVGKSLVADKTAESFTVVEYML